MNPGLPVSTNQLSLWSSYLYQNDGDWGRHSTIFQVSTWAECVVPNICGSFGVCSPHMKSTCTCPLSNGADTFQAIDANDPSKGCFGSKSLPVCNKDEHISTTDYLQLNHTASIFLFSGWDFNATLYGEVDDCKRLCSSDCLCNGFFYQVNNSACFLIHDEMSLLNLTSVRSSLDNVDIEASHYVTYLKMLKPKTGKNLAMVSSRKTMTTVAVVGLILACVLISLFPLGVCVHFTLLARFNRYRQLRTLAKQEKELDDLLSHVLQRFTYNELLEGTCKFTTFLGAGGCGSVYAGTLGDKRLAVKRLEFTRESQISKQFAAELCSIGQTKHQNVIRLVGYCCEGSNRLLVYEYMERGSLDQWLFIREGIDAQQQQQVRLLDWKTRYEIAKGIARGLSYLHEACTPPVLHADIKPQNILLDGKFIPKLGDFGMARLMQTDASAVETGVRGTLGYIAPEWLFEAAVSKNCDIFSTGMVLLEIVGGKKIIDVELRRQMDAGLNVGNHGDEWLFPSWAARKCREKRAMEILDERLEDKFVKDEAERLINTAFWCIQVKPSLRPDAATIVKWLEGNCPVDQPPFESAVHCQSSSNSSMLDEHILNIDDSYP